MNELIDNHIQNIFGCSSANFDNEDGFIYMVEVI